MNLVKKIGFSALFCGLMALPVFAGKGALSVKAEGEITADEVFANLLENTYVLEESHSTFTISGNDTTDGVFSFEISEGENATGDTPITFDVSVLRFLAAEDAYNFVSMGGNKFLFALDYSSVEVSSHGHPEIDGTYTLKEEEPEPIIDPVDPVPEVDPEPAKKGCGSSVIAASALVSGAALLGTVFVSSKKRNK